MALAPPTFPLSQHELARWTRFGEKGGIGRGVAKSDRLAESADQLMFLAGEEIVILLLLDPKNTPGLSEDLRKEPGVVLGYCEQVVGLVRIGDIKLTTRLKKPVVSTRKRASTAQTTPSGGLGIEGAGLAPTMTPTVSSDSIAAGLSDNERGLASPRVAPDMPSPTSSGYYTSTDDDRSPITSTPASSYTSPYLASPRSQPASPQTGHGKSATLLQRVAEDNAALARPLRSAVEPDNRAVGPRASPKAQLWRDPAQDQSLVTPPTSATKQDGYFDVQMATRHHPNPSVSASVTSGTQSPSYNGVLDFYGSSPSSSIASSRASTQRSPVLALATLKRISEAESVESDPATQLGQLFMNSLDSNTPSPNASMQIYPRPPPTLQEVLAIGPRTPEGYGYAITQGSTPTPRAKGFLTTTGGDEEVTTPLAYDRIDPIQTPPPVNTAPLRTSRSSPSLTDSPSRTRTATPTSLPLPASPRPSQSFSPEPTRLRSATFSQVRSAKHQPPPPVTITTARSSSASSGSFVAPQEWQSSPGLSPADGSSSSSGLSSPALLVASPKLQGNGKVRDLRIRTLDRASPTSLKAPSSPLASPGGRKSPLSSPLLSPGLSPPRGGGGGYFSSKRSGSPARPSFETTTVQAVGNVEFEMIAPPAAPPRSSNDTNGSYRRSGSVDARDLEGQSEASDDAGNGWDDAVTKAPADERRLLRQSMLIAEAELEAAAQGLDSHGFYINALQSTESFASGSIRGSSIALSGIGSGPPSPTDSRSLESHRSKELKWVQLMSTPLAQAKKSKKLKGMVRAGIPGSVRSKAWCYLADVKSLRKPGVYHDLCAKESPAHDEIDRTISACYPPHALFASSNSPARVDLASILKAFAVYEPHIGFSRELGYVAGIMLLYVPAESVFWLLVAISRTLTPGLHDSDGDGLREMAFVAGHLLASVEPALAKRLVEVQVDPRSWAASWFLPLFTQTLPWETLLRVLDCFFMEGHRFMLRVGLSMFDVLRDELLTCPLERVPLIVASPPRGEFETPQTLLATIFSTKVKDSSLRRLMRRAEVVIRQGKPRSVA